jgi:NAD(P)-dependent dehydrogenase (short-subunit alcohol dehydrogenase family)
MKQTSSSAILTLGLAAAGAVLAGYALRTPRYSFRGRVVLITGGSRGLGLVMARKLAAEGARLAICARTSHQVHNAREELSRITDVLAFERDVTKKQEVARMIDDIVRAWGRVDVVINNAGVIQAAPVEEMTLDDYHLAMDVHFWAPLYTITAALPHLLPYSASKFALVGLSEGLRAELAEDNISVTVVSPGLMRTGSPRNALFKGQHRAEYAWFAIGDSIPGLTMSAESAARQIIEACREGQSAITLSLPAQAAHFMHGLAPGWVSDVAGVVNRFLPGPGGIGKQAAAGRESQSAWAPSMATILTEQAAARNNEL